MDQSKQEEKLPNLPSSDDEFWSGAEKEKLTPKPPVTCQKGDHLFRQTGSREARCISCPLGYILSPGMTVIDGHIYMGEDVVI